MFKTYTFKTNPLEVYNYINTQILTIKNSQQFTNFVSISPTDLITINTIILDCVERLSDTSILYIRKIHDSNLSIVTIEQICKMLEMHNDLLNKLSNFNNISTDITNNVKNIAQFNFNEDIQNYMNYELINKYKLIILQIIELIKRINIYVDLVKPNINT